MALSAVNIFVRGSVQGVGFRFFARKHAISMKLNGWVKNLSNGDVEIYAEGEKDSLDNYIKLIEKGPAFCHVQEIIINPGNPENKFNEFTIQF